MHTFHLPYGECTITLEDVQLQLGLSVDVSALTRFIKFQWTLYEDPKIRAVILDKSYWSTMLSWRCTRRIECCDNLDFDNRFSWHLRYSMISTKSTYSNRIRIGRQSGRNILKYGKIGMIIYLLGTDYRSRVSVRDGLHAMVQDPWQVIFAVRRTEALVNSCRKGMMRPFKSKEKG